MKTRIAILVVLATLMASPAMAAISSHFEGFEDSGWVAGASALNWQNYGSTITRAASGTDGITSASGAAHAIIGTGSSGPFTRFSGYSSEFGDGFTASLDVYLDPSWADGTGFDFSVAACKQDGDHLRDFIFHVGVVDGDLLVNASNNTNFAFNAWKLENENSGNYYTVDEAGWYTLQYVFRDEGGVLAVDLILLDSDQNVLLTNTLSNSGDLISTVVGGNRYGWFTYNTVSGLAVDNTQLVPTSAVPEPTTLVIWGMFGGLGLVAARRRRRAA